MSNDDKDLPASFNWNAAFYRALRRSTDVVPCPTCARLQAELDAANNMVTVAAKLNMELVENNAALRARLESAIYLMRRIAGSTFDDSTERELREFLAAIDTAAPRGVPEPRIKIGFVEGDGNAD